MFYLKFLGLTLCAAVLSSPLMAQDYPARAVRMIVSFPPGTTPDIVARVVAPKLQKAFGQPFVVENRAGAGGNIAADVVAKSAADGYTLLVSTNAAVATNKVLFQKLPYDPEKDLDTISLLATAPQALVVHQSVPVSDLKGFLAHMKANPGRLSYGSTGSGSASHLTMEVLKSREGVFIVHIPYRGFPQAVGDALSGNVQAMFAIIPAVLPHIKAEKMKALAVTGLKRSSLLPDVPSVQELGMPQLESLAWIGLLAPGNTPPEIVARLATAVRAGLAEDDAKTLLSRAGFDIVASTPTEFRAWQKAEIAKWGAVIRATGATPD